MPQAPCITLHPVSQHVQVHVDGKLLADSTQALELRETGYPTRHYFPRDDVRMDLLALSETTTHCPFKGDMMYFSLGDHKDIAWSYEHPIELMGEISGWRLVRKRTNDGFRPKSALLGNAAGARILVMRPNGN